MATPEQQPERPERSGHRLVARQTSERDERASSATDSDGAPDSPPKKPRLLLSELPAWTGALGTVIAVVAAVFAYKQVNLASVQNEAAQRQSLVALVTDIAQQTRSLTTASPQQQQAIKQARLADAAQGLVLVNALHDHVPAIDDFELGVAFAGSAEYHDALVSYDRAGKAGNDPHYRAVALRNAAAILYALGGRTNDREARTDIQRAYSAYDGQPDVTQFTRDQNYAYAYVTDVRYGARADCGRARRELAAAEHLIAATPALDVVDGAGKPELTAAQDAIARCP